jgi:hypothetical protein
MAMTIRAVTVFGTVHDIKGAEKRSLRKIEDPAYSKLIKQFLEGKDFLFEEASGFGPTKAQHVAEELLGPGRYLDVDPPPDQRSKHGICITGEPRPVDPFDGFSDYLNREFEAEHLKREYLWLCQVLDTDFKKALLVCGFLHALSISMKLRGAGFEVETLTYVPYSKLCPRPHFTSTQKP